MVNVYNADTKSVYFPELPPGVQLNITAVNTSYALVQASNAMQDLSGWLTHDLANLMNQSSSPMQSSSMYSVVVFSYFSCCWRYPSPILVAATIVPGATLFTWAKYAGVSVHLSPGIYSASSFGGADYYNYNSTIASIILATSYKVTLIYSNGRSITVNNNLTDLYDSANSAGFFSPQLIVIEHGKQAIWRRFLLPVVLFYWLSSLVYDLVGCSTSCTGGGVCVGDDTCLCSPRFSGDQCQSCQNGWFGEACFSSKSCALGTSTRDYPGTNTRHSCRLYRDNTNSDGMQCNRLPVP